MSAKCKRSTGECPHIYTCDYLNKPCDIEEYASARALAAPAQPAEPVVQAEQQPNCGNCHKCMGAGWIPNRMLLCPDCGNKRCPKASDHALACTDSNEANQPGSIYGGVPSHPAAEQAAADQINDVVEMVACSSCGLTMAESRILSARRKLKEGSEITDAELADPEYMRAYVEEAHAMMAELSARRPVRELSDAEVDAIWKEIEYAAQRSQQWPFASEKKKRRVFARALLARATGEDKE